MSAEWEVRVKGTARRSEWMKSRASGRGKGDGIRQWGREFDSRADGKPWEGFNRGWHGLIYTGHLEGSFHSSDEEKAQRS